MDAQPKLPRLLDTEFHGGEANEQPEPENENRSAERVAPCYALTVGALNKILTRETDITTAAKKAAKSCPQAGETLR